MIKKTISLLTASLLGLASFFASAQPKPEPLHIGYQKYGTLVLLKARGTLEKRLAAQGVEVRWTEFTGGVRLLEGLNVGAIDFGTTGDAPPIFAQAAGAPLVYVGYEPPTPEGLAIIVPKDSPIRTVQDLRGKRVTVNKGGNVHYLLLRALEQAGLKPTDIEIAFLPPADARPAFERGSVDAWVIWDPFLAHAQKTLGARVIADGKGLTNNYQFYLASQNLAKQRPELVKVLLDEIRATDDYVKANVDAASKELSVILGMEPEVLKLALGRMGYGVQPLNAQVVSEQQRVGDIFYQAGLIPKPVAVKDVVWRVE